MFIYLIENKINNKKYVGMTTISIQERFIKHISESKRNLTKVLYKAFQKYGTQNFSIKQIDSASTHEELIQKEKYWIKFYNTVGVMGYNMTNGGEMSPYKTKESVENHRAAIINHYNNHPETKIKISNSLKKFYENNQQARDHLKNINLGKKASLKSKAKMSLFQKGCKKKWTEQGLKNIGIAASKRNKNKPCPQHVRELNKKAFLENNPMNDPEKRKLVSLSKIGKKRFYREDGSFYMSYPQNPIDPKCKI